MNRSSTVGIPSYRIPPPGLGISTRFTGQGVYSPRINCLRISGHRRFRYSGNSFTVIPSIPGLPPFRFTFRSAVCRFSRSTIFSSNCLFPIGKTDSAFDANNSPLTYMGNHNYFAGLIFTRLSVRFPVI